MATTDGGKGKATPKGTAKGTGKGTAKGTAKAAPKGRGRGAPKATVTQVEAAEKRAKGLRLLASGVTNWDTIAAQCGWANRGTAYREVMRELRAIPAREAADARALIHERYELIFRAMLPAVVQERDEKAARACMEALAGERRMLGLDAPVEARIQVFDDPAADDILDKLSREVSELAERAGEGDSVPREAPADP